MSTFYEKETISQGLVVQFSRNPTPDGSDLKKWLPTDGFPLDFMQIGNENGNSKDLLTMKNDLYPERAEFWENIKAHYPAEKSDHQPLVKGEL